VLRLLANGSFERAAYPRVVAGLAPAHLRLSISFSI
jgi:hypothetical protein